MSACLFLVAIDHLDSPAHCATRSASLGGVWVREGSWGAEVQLLYLIECVWRGRDRAMEAWVYSETHCNTCTIQRDRAMEAWVYSENHFNTCTYQRDRAKEAWVYSENHCNTCTYQRDRAMEAWVYSENHCNTCTYQHHLCVVHRDLTPYGLNRVTHLWKLDVNM